MLSFLVKSGCFIVPASRCDNDYIHMIIHMKHCQAGKLTGASLFRAFIRALPQTWLTDCWCSWSQPLGFHNTGTTDWLWMWLISVARYLIPYNHSPVLNQIVSIQVLPELTLNHIVWLFSVTQGCQANKDTHVRHDTQGFRNYFPEANSKIETLTLLITVVFLSCSIVLDT